MDGGRPALLRLPRRHVAGFMQARPPAPPRLPRPAPQLAKTTASATELTASGFMHLTGSDMDDTADEADTLSGSYAIGGASTTFSLASGACGARLSRVSSRQLCTEAMLKVLQQEIRRGRRRSAELSACADLVVCDAIGRGGFGSVYKGTWHTIPAAIKVRGRMPPACKHVCMYNAHAARAGAWRRMGLHGVAQRSHASCRVAPGPPPPAWHRAWPQGRPLNASALVASIRTQLLTFAKTPTPLTATPCYPLCRS